MRQRARPDLWETREGNLPGRPGTAPLLFAGLVFADAFADSPAPGFALGWNVLGAVVGGLAENVSYLLGIPALVPVAALFYALALLPRRARAADVLPVSVPA